MQHKTMSNKHNDTEGKAAWEARKSAGGSRFMRFILARDYHPPHKEKPETRQQRHYADRARKAAEKRGGIGI